MLSVVMLSVILLSVVAPEIGICRKFIFIYFLIFLKRKKIIPLIKRALFYAVILYIFSQ